MIFIGWFFGTIIVTLLADNRKLGMLWGFIISLLLSPLIGLIAVLASDKKYPQEVIIKNEAVGELGQLERWKKLLDDGVISQEEFEKKKTEILNS